MVNLIIGKAAIAFSYSSNISLCLSPNSLGANSYLSYGYIVA